MYASWIAANFWFSEAAISFAERVFSKFGSSKSRSATNAMPTFGALTKPLTEKPGERDRVRDAGLCQHDVRHAADDCLRPIERRGLRQLREGDEIFLVLLRDEAFRHAPEAEPRDADERRRR